MYSWEVGSKRPVGINIEKAWNLFLLILYSEVLENLVTRINNECPRRYVNHCGTQRIKHTKGHLSLSCFGLRKFPVFRVPKQAPINAFYYVCYPSPLMCRHPQRRFTMQRYEKKCICAKKVYFYCHRLHFFTVASRIKVPSKILQNLQSCNFFN